MTPPSSAVDIATGVVVFAAAGVACLRRPQSRVGTLLGLTGLSWLAGDVWSGLLYAHRGPLVHALLTHPAGRTRSPVVILVIGAAYGDGFVPALARSPWPTLALAAAVAGVALWRCVAARGLDSRARLIPLGGAAVTWGALAVAAVEEIAGVGVDALTAWAYDAAVGGVAIALVAELVSGRPARAAATGLVVELGGAGQAPAGVRDALARAVGDRRLAILYRAAGRWVDEAGRPIELPRADAEKEVSKIEDDNGAPIAAIVHDPAALRDEMLARSVVAAVRLAVENVRLQADVEARVREVAESRRRLVEASDVERRRLREQLRAGAELRLARVGDELQRLAASRNGSAAATLLGLAAELAAARGDLARFAQGVHPQALTDHGLAAALRALAAQAAVPVELEVAEVRLPGPHEAAAYFVCSEALANVGKYAEASRTQIAVAASRARLVVRVSDDGKGGADPRNGSGLRGLADRVEALGGQLSVHSPAGEGTTLTAELPITGMAAR